LVALGRSPFTCYAVLSGFLDAYMHDNGVVLLVDDNPTDADLIRTAFKTAGFNGIFHVLPDGEQAMQYFVGTAPYFDRSKFPMPHLLLLDLRMPRVGGLELLTWLRTHDFGKTLPVIVMTESSYDKDITSAYRLGARTFLTKPFAPADFIAALKYTTDNWLHGTPLPVGAPFTPPPKDTNNPRAS
jgi:two-component system response regulator